MALSPNIIMNRASRKNLDPRPINDAITKVDRRTSKAPADMVNSLYGTGVKPAMAIDQAPYL